MNARQRKILKLILKDMTCSIEEIANRYNVSTRTIRSDAEHINKEIEDLYQTRCLSIKNNYLNLIIEKSRIESISALTISDDYLYKIRYEF